MEPCQCAGTPDKTGLGGGDPVSVDRDLPGQGKNILVMDNLNTHVKASLYQAFSAPKVAGLANRLEIHYTPKHGSWLDIAEIKLNAMTRQCLNRRIAEIEELRQELAKWESERN